MCFSYFEHLDMERGGTWAILDEEKDVIIAHIRPEKAANQVCNLLNKHAVPSSK